MTNDIEQDGRQPGLLAQINGTWVDYTVMSEVLLTIARLPPDERGDLTARTIAAIRIIEGMYDLTEPDRVLLAVAVQFRLQALATIVKSNELTGLNIPGLAGEYHLLPDYVVEVAASTLLEDHPDGVRFDPMRFRRNLLEIMPPAGAA